ncbi:MAG: hypothetical protein U0R66_17385 [Mycobacterium sp.]
MFPPIRLVCQQRQEMPEGSAPQDSGHRLLVVALEERRRPHRQRQQPPRRQLEQPPTGLHRLMRPEQLQDHRMRGRSGQRAPTTRVSPSQDFLAPATTKPSTP